MQLAVTLVAKLSAYTVEDKVSFAERARTEADELSGEVKDEY